MEMSELAAEEPELDLFEHLPTESLEVNGAGAREHKDSKPPVFAAFGSSLWGESANERSIWERGVSVAESGWNELSYSGGRLMLLTMMILSSLVLLGLYLRSSLRARRRDLRDARVSIEDFQV